VESSPPGFPPAPHQRVNAITQPITNNSTTPILPTSRPSSPPTPPAPQQRVPSPLSSSTISTTHVRPSNAPPHNVHFVPIAPNHRPPRPTSPVSRHVQRIAQLELELQEALAHSHTNANPPANPNAITLPHPNATPHPNAALTTQPNPNYTPTTTTTTAPT